MLRKVSRSKSRVKGHMFAIVASKYNARYVEGMLKAACEALRKGGAARVDVVRVPGAFEIPVVAARLAAGVNAGTGQGVGERESFSAIICLGVILRGATTHAQHIGEAVSQALVHIQIEHLVPVIHEVLLLENEEQARERCLSKEHNRGAEAAFTAMEMAAIMKGLGG